MEDEVSVKDVIDADAERAVELLNSQTDSRNSEEPIGHHRRDPTRPSNSMSPLIAV